MTPEHWREVDVVLAAALELPEMERSGYVARQCEGRPELRAEVETLLRSSHDAGDFIEGGPLISSCAGRRIGSYRVVEQVGQGGMGAVFRAERDDDQFHKQVAIKLIGGGLEGREELVRRFVDERQIQASLEHPNIARLLDGGVAGDGSPYIVMEFVEGVPITQYAGTQKLDRESRLRLFLHLCDAVEFAHQRLVVHRDLKPGNVLVTADGCPKLLDFGIAKLLGGTSLRTKTMFQALTPDYASPEQLRGAPVTTAADVYSLGVILYEMEAGERPYRVSGKSAGEAVEIVCEREPERPSAIAGRRVPEDLEAIILKAMRKDPAERYRSVQALADDIERFLAGLPVRARRGTLRYVASRFVRRHRVAVAAGACIVGLVLFAGGAIVREYRIASRQRDRAERRFRDLRRLAHSLIFDLHDKIQPLPGSTPVRKELIATAIGYLDGLARDARGDASLEHELAQAYLKAGDVQGNASRPNLGDPAGALASYRKSEQIARALSAAAPADVSARIEIAQALTAEGSVHHFGGEKKKAEACLREALEIARSLSRQSPGDDTIQKLLATSLLKMGDLGLGEDRGLSCRLEAIRLFEALLARKPRDAERQRNAALAHKDAGGTLLGLNRASEALPYLERARALDEQMAAQSPGDPQPKLDLSFDYSQLADYYWPAGDRRKSLAFSTRMLELRRTLVNDDPQDMWKRDRLRYALWHMAWYQCAVGDTRAALASYEESKTVASSIVGHEQIRLSGLADAEAGIAWTRGKLGERQASCVSYAEAVRLYRQLGGKDPGGSASLQDKLHNAEAALRRCQSERR